MTRYWIGWNELLPVSQDSPQHSWITGWGDGYATVCAIVDAKSKDDAHSIIESNHHVIGWNFCRSVGNLWMPPSDRFPH